MTLDELITALETAVPTLVVKHGFNNPHSYRGDYLDLAFEPTTNITVGAMLADARAALGATYQGYKGGEFTMTADTWCWLSAYGDASGETLSPLVLQAMLADPAAPPAPADADLRDLVRGVIRDCPALYPDDIADRVLAALQSAYRRLLARLEADRASHLRATGQATEEVLRIDGAVSASTLRHAAARVIAEFEGPDAAQAYMQRTEGGEAGQDPAVLPAPADQAADGLAATTCSAQYRGDEDGARLCIRAAQHTGKAHTDEHGIHWSDTVAEYPIADGAFRVGTNVRAELRRMADEAQQAEQECSSSISGSCLSLFESDVPCDTSAGECVHGGKPAVEARQADTAGEA